MKRYFVRSLPDRLDIIQDPMGGWVLYEDARQEIEEARQSGFHVGRMAANLSASETVHGTAARTTPGEWSTDHLDGADCHDHHIPGLRKALDGIRNRLDNLESACIPASPTPCPEPVDPAVWKAIREVLSAARSHFEAQKRGDGTTPSLFVAVSHLEEACQCLPSRS